MSAGDFWGRGLQCGREYDIMCGVGSKKENAK